MPPADVRARDYRRYLAILRAHPAQRDALFALTAFYLELAHIAGSVSEPMLGAIRFSWWREALEALEKGEGPKNHPVLQALHVRGGIPYAPLYAMIAAREADIDPSLLPDEAGFLAYLDATSGALHLLWAHALGDMRHDEAILALSRGYAILGIVRAIPHYAAQGQLCLPRSVMERYGLAFDASSLAAPDERIVSLVEYLHAKAVVYLSHATPYGKHLPAPHRVLLAFAYSDAGALKRAGYDPYHPVLRKLSPLSLVWKAMWA